MFWEGVHAFIYTYVNSERQRAAHIFMTKFTIILLHSSNSVKELIYNSNKEWFISLCFSPQFCNPLPSHPIHQWHPLRVLNDTAAINCQHWQLKLPYKFHKHHNFTFCCLKKPWIWKHHHFHLHHVTIKHLHHHINIATNVLVFLII